MSHPHTANALEALQFALPSPHVDIQGAVQFVAELFVPGTSVLRVAFNLSRRILQQFDYQGGMTDVFTPVPHVMGAMRGVCQDFAHVAIARLRAAGLAARYVSGYLATQPTRGATRLTGADASHAWLSVWCPEFGWVDFNPKNDVIPGTDHITLGWGRDYSDVSPTKGFIHGGGAQTLDVAVQVLPIPTTPHTQESS